MKNRLITIFLVILLVVGVGILSYPMISNMLHDRKKDEILTEYNEEMEKLPDEKLEAAREAAERYNRSLMDTIIISDPFDPDTVRSLDEDYMQTLNLEKNGVMAYVEVPRLDITEPRIRYWQREWDIWWERLSLSGGREPMQCCPDIQGFRMRRFLQSWTR